MNTSKLVGRLRLHFRHIGLFASRHSLSALRGCAWSLLIFGVAPFAAQAADEPVPQAVSDAVAALMPNTKPDSIAPAPVKGMYQVVLGPHVFYLSADGQHMLRGDILELQSRRNLSAPVRNRARVDAVNKLGEESMIVFASPKPEHVVTIFTDVDCGYCAKLHREMDEYLSAGISIRYIAFPRAGVPSSSYDDMVSVWCADDQRQAMTDAKARKPVTPASCDNPVADHYDMGRLVGVRGTPTIVMETGDLVPGYLPADRLREAIEEAKSEAPSS